MKNKIDNDNINVGIDVTILQPGLMGGCEQAFRQMFSALIKFYSEDQYFLYATLHNYRSFKLYASHNTRVKVNNGIPLQFSQKSEKLLNKLIRRLKLNAIYSLDQIKMNHINVLHFPFTVMDLCHNSLPTVSTIHDLQHIYYPSFFSKEELVWRNATWKNISYKATCIAVPSSFTKKTIIDAYQVPSEKIHVVYWGVDHEKFQNARLNANGKDSIKKKYNLPTEFLFYPAKMWLHKNHCILLDSINQLKVEHNLTIPIYFSGQSDKATVEIRERIKKYKLEKQVRFLGYIPDADVPYLYACASLFIYPSLFEGFGLPVLEAMAAGCPVVCSNASSLPEIVDNAGVYFDPNNPEMIAEAIRIVLSDSTLRSELIKKGNYRISAFSWENTAHSMYDVYRKAVIRYNN